MVERLRGKHLRQLRITVDHRDFQRLEQLGKRLGQHLRRARHHFRGLEDRPVARRQYAGQGAEQGEQRCIPGTQNADGAFGLMHDPGLGAQLIIGCEHLAWLVFEPMAEMVAGVFERCQ